MTYTSSTLEKRQFFGYWRWIHIRICEHCHKETKILGGNTKKSPDLPPGAIICPHCNNGKVKF